jgi:hypothetical protein
MRIYACLLGVLLTAGSAYLGQLAVTSAGFERAAGKSPGRQDLGARGELWYGGVLAPIAIEAPRPMRPSFAAFGPPRAELAASQKAVESARLAHAKRRTVAAQTVRASVGSMM